MHVNQNESSAIFRDELRAHDARPGTSGWSSGTTTATACSTSTHLDELVPDLAERLSYACGPAGLLDALEKHHAERGLSLHHRAVPPHPPRGRRRGQSGGTVTFADGREVDADGSTPILDAAEGAGVLMPSGCRMGICMGCVIPMKSGAVRDLRNGALTVAVPGETGPEGVPIQTCISAAAGACHIDEGARSR